ncbi:MAG: hypothetical protein RLN70_03495, partial [Rhodospirillaceae bacterium]
MNFLRRWLPGVSDWITLTKRGQLGSPLEARLVYNRGWRHNGCHGTDLIGAAMGARCTGVTIDGDPIFDFSEDD